MNIFELAKLSSPVGGAVGGVMAVAVHHTVPTPTWMLVAIPIGLVCGFGCYPCLIRLAIGSHDRNPKMPSWRIAAILGISCFAPFIAGALSFGLVGLLLYVLT